ncbi:hypothetical protein VSVS05_04411 (plasmid) [Vibrio scophthalmi]|uniref:Uncharacterized protein n=1 Tax=Vibrio scophthalmi TaxID=45658 RepID=A0A1C7FHR7_9VIBR|nr:hypothetical protein VSVS05_04411 [Vibrio scophthalmi]
MSCKHLPGEACHCNQQTPCLIRYQIDSDAGSIQYQNGQFTHQKLVLLDEGKGAKVLVSVEGNCGSGLPTCPSGYITDNQRFSETLSATACQQHVLTYKAAPSQKMGLLSALQHLLAEKKTTSVPYTRYQVCLTQCVGKPQVEQTLWLSPPLSYLLGQVPMDSFIYVYPKVKIESELTLSAKSVTKTISDEERYVAYQNLESANRLNGLSIPSEEIKKSVTLDGKLTINQGSEKIVYGSGLTTTRSNIPGQTNLVNLNEEFENIRQQLKTIDAIVSIVEQIKQGTYESTGQDKVKLVNFEFKSPQISIKGSQTLTIVDNVMGTDSEVTVGFAPLFGFSLKLDMLLAAAAYFKVEKPVAAIRQKAAELEQLVKDGHQGAYAGAEFDITLSGSLSTEGKITQKLKQSPQYGFDCATTIALSSMVNVRGGAKVWVVQGAFKMIAEVVAEGKCALRSTLENGKPRVELVFFHEGIKAKVTIETSMEIVSNKDDKQTSNNSSENALLENPQIISNVRSVDSEAQEWIWVESLSEQQSTYRSVLIG